jgi:hypothetical protein
MLSRFLRSLLFSASIAQSLASVRSSRATVAHSLTLSSQQQKVELVELEAPDGSIKANFVSYGAAVQSLWVKDKVSEVEVSFAWPERLTALL